MILGPCVTAYFFVYLHWVYNFVNILETYQIVYQYVGQPTAFYDSPANGYYINDVIWAVENSVTSGTTDTTFGPFVTCERCMIVTFLYRALAE